MYQLHPLIHLSSHFDQVILADGDYPSHPIALHLLTTATRLVCCDRAGMRAIEHGLHPEAIVGDGDSIPDDFRRAHAALFYHEAEQDDNDLTKATRFMLQHTGPADGQPSSHEMDSSFHGQTSSQNMDTFADSQSSSHEVDSTAGVQSSPQKSDSTVPSDTDESVARPIICYLGATGKREDHTIGNISLMIHYYRNFGISPVMVTDYGWWIVGEGDVRLETFEHQQVSVLNVSCHESLNSTGLRWPTRPFTALWQGTLNDALGTEVTLSGDGIYLVFRTFERKE